MIKCPNCKKFIPGAITFGGAIPEEDTNIPFKVGDLVTIQPYVSITKILPTIKEAEVTFENGYSVFLPFVYLCPAPIPERMGEK